MMTPTYQQLIEREDVKRQIERIVIDRFPRLKTLHNKVRHANGFRGDGFIGMPMSNAEREILLDALFGYGRWCRPDIP
jgi:hypothetical protein